MNMTTGSDVQLDGRWLVLGGGSRLLAERFARRLGVHVVGVLDQHEVRGSPLALRALATAQSIDGVLLHSVDWSRQLGPQLLALAAAAVPGVTVLIADERTGKLEPISRRMLVAQSARIPVEALQGLDTGAREAFRFVRGSRWPKAPTRSGARAPRMGIKPGASAGPLPAVIAVWMETPPEGIGGAVTHISGILKGFRSAGLRVGLVTNGPPPVQLAAVVDDVELTTPFSRGERLASLAEGLAANERVRRAGYALARRLPAAFVYQRHRAYLVAGHDLARRLGCPLVVEFNASEAWHRAHWINRIPGERALDPLLRAMERRAVTQSTLVAAVSVQAARMARELGAPAEAVEVVPNGVDLDEVDRARRGVTESASASGPRVGWIGSFGPWHGAAVLIQALASMGGDTGLVMIGDGPECIPCQALARSLGLTGRVQFRGPLPHREALRLLSGCDVLASPHVPLDGVPFFGSPTKLFEYMAIGRPIVASELEQLGQVLEHGRTAVLVAPGDPERLAAGISAVLAMPDRGAQLGRAARQEAMDSHTWERRARVIIERLGVGGR